MAGGADRQAARRHADGRRHPERRRSPTKPAHVHTFAARPTDEVGHYVAEVTFPAAGEWKTRLYDGFTDAVPHRLSPLTVAPAGGASASAGDFPWEQTVAIAFVALLFLGGIVATLDRPLLRRRRAGAVPRPVAH